MKRRSTLAALSAPALAAPALLATAADAWLSGRSAHAASPARPTGADALAIGPGAVILGNPAGDVTIVEFFDYQCGYCRQMQPAMKALLRDDPGLRLVHRHWPVLGRASVPAARIALASQWQEGRYVAVHAALMRLLGRGSEARYRAAARDAGLDLAVLDQALAGRARDLATALDVTAVQARRLRLQGTPALVIGRQLLAGAVDLTTMQQAVARARAAG